MTGVQTCALPIYTLVVDETSQTPATGRILAFGDNYAMTDAGAIYPGVHFVRTAAMLNPDLVVFVDQVTADKPHTLDLVVHLNGKWRTAVSGAAPHLASKDGYQHLRDVAARTTTDGVALSVDSTNLRLAGSDPTEVITATGVGKSTEDRIPVAIFRRVAQKTTYVWSVSADPVELSFREQDGAISVIVKGKGEITVRDNTVSIR